MQRIVTFKLDEELLRVLDTYAKMKGMSRSEVIRAAIESLLKREGIKIPETRSEPKYDPRAQVIEVVI